MKMKLIRKIHEMQMEILKTKDKELNKIAVDLLEIEKKIMVYESPNKEK